MVINGLTCRAQFGQCEYTLSILSHLDSQNSSLCALEAALKGCWSQRLFHWIVEAIALAYASAGVQCPIGLWATPQEEWPPPGPGPAESLLGRFVRPPAGRRCLPLLDYTVWTSLPCSCGYYLLNANSPSPSARKGL